MAFIALRSAPVHRVMVRGPSRVAAKPWRKSPPSRELATQLGVHRTTVANAYAELESEGLISGHVGRGTYISGEGAPKRITPANIA